MQVLCLNLPSFFASAYLGFMSCRKQMRLSSGRSRSLPWECLPGSLGLCLYFQRKLLKFYWRFCLPNFRAFAVCFARVLSIGWQSCSTSLFDQSFFMLPPNAAKSSKKAGYDFFTASAPRIRTGFLHPHEAIAAAMAMR